MTKLQSVAKLNPVKLKISLEYSSILNITQKKIIINSKNHKNGILEILIASAEAAARGVLCKKVINKEVLNKVAGLRPAILLKKRLWDRCFPVNFAKFLRAPFLQNISERLLLLLDILIRASYDSISRWNSQSPDYSIS